jgi:transketolase
MELFAAQDEGYRTAVTGDAPIRIAVEAAVRQSWDWLIGLDGLFVGMSTFGESGPYKKVYEHFGITPKAVADAVVKRHGSR